MKRWDLLRPCISGALPPTSTRECAVHSADIDSSPNCSSSCIGRMICAGVVLVHVYCLLLTCVWPAAESASPQSVQVARPSCDVGERQLLVDGHQSLFRHVLRCDSLRKSGSRCTGKMNSTCQGLPESHCRMRSSAGMRVQAALSCLRRSCADVRTNRPTGGIYHGLLPHSSTSAVCKV